MKKFLLLVVLLYSVNLFALSKQVQYDMLKVKLTEQLKSKKYTASLKTVNKIKDLNIALPNSFLYFEGKALFEAGLKAKSYKQFGKYVEISGNQAEYYNQAIIYLVKAEKEFLKAEQKFLKAEIAKTKERKKRSLITGVVKDPKTELVWQDNFGKQSVKKTFKDAKLYCENLSLSNRYDWRLPSMRELGSILNYYKKPTTVGIFNNVPSSNYWASSSFALSFSHKYNFGATYSASRSTIYSVRCVRGEERSKQFSFSRQVQYDMLKIKLVEQIKSKKYTASLETISKLKDLGEKLPKSFLFFEGKALFESGRQAESYKKFEEYVETYGRKVKYYNETITYLIKIEEIFKNREVKDKRTGLVWQDDLAVQSVKKTFKDAKSYCRTLSLGNRHNWRLPRRDELISIIDYSKYNPAIVDGFKYVPDGVYWSSSEYINYDSYIWAAGFYYGQIIPINKLEVLNVRCVRDIQ